MFNKLKINSFSQTCQKIEVTGQTATPKIGEGDTGNHSLLEQRPTSRNLCGNQDWGGNLTVVRELL